MNILVVSPHPDDETLGAGGTLIKMKKLGHKVYWLNITDMVGEKWDTEVTKKRQKQIDTVKDLYGFDGFFNLRLPPTQLSSLEEGEIISKIKEIIAIVKPEWLIIPGQYDAHSDHRTVYNCCMACTKAFRSPFIKRITTMEIISETDYGFQKELFEPNLFIDISDELEDKIRIMKEYVTEIGSVPFPRSLENIRALATFRGGSCNCRFAEAFCIVKQME